MMRCSMMLGKGDGVFSSEFLVGSDLIGKSFFGSLHSCLLSFPNFLVSGLFGIGFTWITFSFRFKLGERWSSWSSGCGSVLLSIIFSFLFFLTWSISFSGFFLLFGWLSSSQLSVSTIRVTEWLWNNLGNPVLMPRVGSNTFSVSWVNVGRFGSSISSFGNNLFVFGNFSSLISNLGCNGLGSFTSSSIIGCSLIPCSLRRTRFFWLFLWS